MANIGYRTFNGSSDLLDVVLGNLASAASVPETWIFAGRFLNVNSDAEIAHTAGYDPLDWYIQGVAHKLSMYDGSQDSNADGPAPGTTNDVIVVFRRGTATVNRWSIATNSGSGWSSFTHTNGTTTFSSRSYPSSGVIEFCNTLALNCRMAAVARCNTAISDSDVATLTADLASWEALPSITNLWRADQTPVVDLVGTASQNSLTGTSVTANAFPLDAGGPRARIGEAHNGWNSVLADTGVDIDCDAPGAAALVVVKFHMVHSVAWANIVTCSGGGLTWVKIGASSNTGSGFVPACVAFYAITTTDPGSFTATVSWGTGLQDGMYFCEVDRYEAGSFNSSSPIGGKVFAGNQSGNGAITQTLDAAPAVGDYTEASSHADENSANRTAIMGTSAGAWTVSYPTSTPTDGYQNAYLSAYRTGSTSTSVPWADVNTGTDTFGSSQIAFVVKAASAGAPIAQTVDAAPLTLTGVGVAATGTGVAAVDIPTAVLALGGQTLAAAAVGAATVTVDPATLTFTGQALAAAATGVAAVDVPPAGLTLAGQIPVAGGVGVAAIDIDPAVLAIAGVEVSVAGSTVTVTIQPAVLELAGGDIIAGGVGVAAADVGPATITIGGGAVVGGGAGAATVTVDPATITIAAQAVTGTPQGVATVTIDPAVLTLAGALVAPVGAPVLVTIEPAVLRLDGVVPAVRGVGIVAREVDTATITLAGVDVVGAPAGAVRVTIDPAALTLVGDTITATAVGVAAVDIDPAVLIIDGVAVTTEGGDVHPLIRTGALRLVRVDGERLLVGIDEDRVLIRIDPERLLEAIT